MKVREHRHVIPKLGARKPLQTQWPLIAVFLTATLVVGSAAMLERRPTAVTLTLESSELAFTLAEALSLYEVSSPAVQLAGIASMRMQVARAELPASGASAGPPLSGNLTVRPIDGRSTLDARLSSEIVSSTMRLAAGTRVRIVASGQHAPLRVELVGGAGDLRMVLSERAEMRCDGCTLEANPPASLPTSAPLLLTMAQRAVDAHKGDGAMVLGLRPPVGRESIELWGPEQRVKVERMEFWRVVEGRAQSTLLDDAYVAFSQSKAQPEVVHRGDLLQLGCEAPADLYLLESGVKLRARVTCEASALRAGSEDQARSLMPSYLTWWYTNEKLMLLVTAVGSLFGVILLVLQRLGLLARSPQ
jgi:hypothetical protein